MELSEIRKEIDAVDAEIKRLFIRRMELADNVAGVKAETGDVIFKPDREKQIIDKLTEGVEPAILREYTALIKRIMEISRKYQYGRTLELRDCLNVEYIHGKPQVKNVAVVKTEMYLYEEILRSGGTCYRTEQAGQNQESTKEGLNILLADSYEDIARLIREGKADSGIGILEEIGKGVSDELHNVLYENELYIYKCKIIEEASNDIYLKKKAVIFTPKFYAAEADNRIKAVFVCKNRSGSLGSILSMISDYGVNLTEIHSKPDMKSEWNYEFMVEFEACFMNKEIKALIYQLMNETEYFRILGSYRCEE